MSPQEKVIQWLRRKKGAAKRRQGEQVVKDRQQPLQQCIAPAFNEMCIAPEISDIVEEIVSNVDAATLSTTVDSDKQIDVEQGLSASSDINEHLLQQCIAPEFNEIIEEIVSKCVEAVTVFTTVDIDKQVDIEGVLSASPVFCCAETAVGCTTVHIPVFCFFIFALTGYGTNVICDQY